MTVSYVGFSQPAIDAGTISSKVIPAISLQAGDALGVTVRFEGADVSTCRVVGSLGTTFVLRETLAVGASTDLHGRFFTGNASTTGSESFTVTIDTARAYLFTSLVALRSSVAAMSFQSSVQATTTVTNNPTAASQSVPAEGGMIVGLGNYNGGSWAAGAGFDGIGGATFGWFTDGSRYINNTGSAVAKVPTATFSSAVKTFLAAAIFRAPNAAPGPVTGLAFSAVGSTSMTVTGTPTSGGESASSFRLEKSIAGANSFSSVTTQASAVFAVTGLTAGTAYDWRMIAINGFGSAAASSIATQGTNNPATSGGGYLSAALVISSPSTYSVAEGLSTIATLIATAFPPGPALTWSITGGADASLFTLGASSGVLSYNGVLDYENPHGPSYAVSVQVTDGTNTATQNIVITITNVIEPGPESVPAQITGPLTATFGQSVVFTVTNSVGSPLPGIVLRSAAGAFLAPTNAVGQATLLVGVKAGAMLVIVD